MNDLFEEWVKYGFESEESYNHYLTRQIFVELGMLRKTNHLTFYNLIQRMYTRDLRKHSFFYHEQKGGLKKC